MYVVNGVDVGFEPIDDGLVVGDGLVIGDGLVVGE